MILRRSVSAGYFVYDRNGVTVLGESSPMWALWTDGLFWNFRNLDLGNMMMFFAIIDFESLPFRSH